MRSDVYGFFDPVRVHNSGGVETFCAESQAQDNRGSVYSLRANRHGRKHARSLVSRKRVIRCFAQIIAYTLSLLHHGATDRLAWTKCTNEHIPGVTIRTSVKTEKITQSAHVGQSGNFICPLNIGNVSCRFSFLPGISVLN